MSGTTTLFVGSQGTTVLASASSTVLQVSAGPTVLRGVQGLPGPAQADVLTTLGDVLTHNGTDAIRLGVGTDGQLIQADSGAAEGISWQDPVAVSSPLIAKGDLYTFAAVDARLPIGADGQFLRANSTPAEGLEWDTLDASDLPAHATTHSDGGADEIVVENLATASANTAFVLKPDGLGGLVFAAEASLPPLAHGATHENGGTDEINVAGLSGLLGDAQAPIAHAASHENGGTDEINVLGLSGLLGDPQTPLAHSATHENGGTDEISVAGLSGLLADAQSPLGHAAAHLPNGSDPLTTAVAVTIDADTPNAEGVAETFARADHTHDLPTAAPVDVGAANAGGASASFSRADHVHSHGNLLGGALHAAATTAVSGFLSAADKTKLDGLPTSAVPDTRSLAAGDGLLGGGDLSADRTLDVVANADGSIVANANDVQVGVLATDAQHGVRGGGTQHAIATGAVSGFMSAVDKSKLDGIPGDGDAQWLRLDASNDPLTGELQTQDVVPTADQAREIGGDTDRFIRMSSRLGVFVGSSAASGSGAPVAGGVRNFGANPTGIMGGNQAEGGTGAATHYLRGGSFKGVACIGNAAAGSTGDATLRNNSGGSSLFGSAYTYGAGDATVEATAFGNFTTAYAYCQGNNHSFRNLGAGGFLSGYSQGAGTVLAQISNGGQGAFMNVRPQAPSATATAQAVASGAGSFVQGSLVAGVAGQTTTLRATANGAFSQGRVQGGGGAGGSLEATGVGAFAQGVCIGESLTASGQGAMAQGRASTFDIVASGDGSLAHGDSTAGAITASATNATQLGPGTNALADSLQVGSAGLRLKGTTGAPGTLQDGDVWVSGGSVFVRTGGVTKNLDAV